MKTSNKVWLLWIASLVLTLFYFNGITLVATIFIGYVYFYLHGKEVATVEVAKTAFAGIMTVAPTADSLKCDYCGKPPHLTETKEDKWACDTCYMKWWGLHCPDCGVEVPREWTGDQRQAHLDSHTTTLNKDATVGSAA